MEVEVRRVRDLGGDRDMTGSAAHQSARWRVADSDGDSWRLGSRGSMKAGGWYRRSSGCREKGRRWTVTVTACVAAAARQEPLGMDRASDAFTRGICHMHTSRRAWAERPSAARTIISGPGAHWLEHVSTLAWRHGGCCGRELTQSFHAHAPFTGRKHSATNDRLTPRISGTAQQLVRRHSGVNAALTMASVRPMS